MARNMLLAKIAPAFRTIMGNSDGPLMDLFREFSQRTANPKSHNTAGAVARPAAASGPGRVGQAQPRTSESTVPVSRENQP